MNISHKPVILCFVFTVLGSTSRLQTRRRFLKMAVVRTRKKRPLVMFRYQNLAQRLAVRVAACRMRLKMIGPPECSWVTQASY
ncbi:MAG: hypothetical protein QOJ15_1195 [Bradyrhizobium sp.]|nr:hypothetical protein [Bradyrhizobium sp.]